MNRPPSPLTMLLSRHTRRREIHRGVSARRRRGRTRARAQQRRLPVRSATSCSASRDLDAGWRHGFRQGLGETGYVEGRNVAIEYRWAGERNERLPALAADLVSRQVSSIATSGHVLGGAGRQGRDHDHPHRLRAPPATRSPLGSSPASTSPAATSPAWRRSSVELERKRLELLHSVVPKAAVIGALIRPINPNAAAQLSDLQEAAQALGLKLQVALCRSRARLRCASLPGWRVLQARRSRDRDRRPLHQPQRAAWPR